jgi:hypothetical protein
VKKVKKVEKVAKMKKKIGSDSNFIIEHGDHKGSQCNMITACERLRLVLT